MHQQYSSNINKLTQKMTQKMSQKMSHTQIDIYYE
jgi:hypothetical protein